MGHVWVPRETLETTNRERKATLLSCEAARRKDSFKLDFKREHAIVIAATDLLVMLP